MKSQREVLRRYNKLLKDIDTDDYYKIDITNRVNCYICSCGKIIRTKDIDVGVTPFMIRCEKCGQMAHSDFYIDRHPDVEISHEWYRPTYQECCKMRKRDDILDHVLQGGLVMRKINKEK